MQGDHVTAVYFPVLLHQNQLETAQILESWDQVCLANDEQTNKNISCPRKYPHPSDGRSYGLGLPSTLETPLNGFRLPFKNFAFQEPAPPSHPCTLEFPMTFLQKVHVQCVVIYMWYTVDQILTDQCLISK